MRKSYLLLMQDIRAIVEEKGYCLYMPGRDELVLSSEIEYSCPIARLMDIRNRGRLSFQSGADSAYW